MNSSEVRRQFIDFFREKDHAFVPSAPVVPYNDPTLLFTNAGMNQFKDVFLGTGRRDYVRAVNTQKCIRAGGKHNDLDDVGHDTYHHTFFEMLGNWSFGDYFKEQAIAWAWELLTERWKLDKSRLHATVFGGDPDQGLEPDTEAAARWRQVTDIDPRQIHTCGKKDNFWEMGDTGPCGPCSEIHVDLTADGSGRALVNAGDPRVIEIWNLVFIQFNRDASGMLRPLPDRHVDTGMGFERITAILQGRTSNYDTDIFQPIFEDIRAVTGAPAYSGRLESGGRPDARILVDVAYRVIADHLRCLVFAISDRATLGNEGRGYVLRRILRRAVRYGRQYLGTTRPFLHRLVPGLVDHMGEAFPELGRNPNQVIDIIRDEEDSFGKTYERGIRLFEDAAVHASTHGRGKISGESAFRLHDTYGFAIDLTMLMAEERDLKVDLGEYERLMDEARERARGAAGSAGEWSAALDPAQLEQAGPCDDAPKYDPALTCSSTIGACVLAEGTDRVLLTTARTCFYAEQGGQVSDTGRLRTASGTVEIDAVQRHGHHIIHRGRVVEGEVRAGQECTLEVDGSRRAIMKNHTATHMLNWALRRVLGDHVEQKGSLVDADKTRFDFSHPKPVTVAELQEIERRVCDQISGDQPVYIDWVPLAEAKRMRSVRAVFGEKYPDPVRVVSVGAPIDALRRDPDNATWLDFSVEFCGGTHLGRSAEAAGFRIVEETGVAKGIRRLTAVTGERAEACARTDAELLQACTALADLPDDTLATQLPELTRRVATSECSYLVRMAVRERLAELQARARRFDKAQAQAGGRDVRSAAAALLAAAEDCGGTRVIVGEVPAAGPEQVREALDYLRREAGSAAIMLGCAAESKVLLFAAMTDDLVARGLRAGDLIQAVAPAVGGGGGGKPQLAQAGGKNPQGLPQALQEARAWIRRRLDPPPPA